MDCVTVIGVDRCRNGWIAAVGEPGDDGIRLEAWAELPALVDCYREATIAVDIPIGLSEAGQRRADMLAKGLLGRRSSSVFLAPIRAAAEAAEYSEANRISKTLSGQGLSAQSWALVSAILEASRCAEDRVLP